MSTIRPKFLASPVLITVGGSSGSGFYLSDRKTVYLVSARHVLFKDGLETLRDPVTLTSLDAETREKSTSMKLDCQALMADGNLKKHERSDIAVARISALGNAEEIRPGEPGPYSHMYMVSGAVREDSGSSFGMDIATAVHRTTKVGETVFLFGYPTSLAGADFFEKGTPLLRTGIIAGVNSHEQMVIDCPVYFGNSGGLVAHMDAANNLIFAVGVAIKMIPFIETLYSTQYREKVGTRYENSGYALVEPIDRVLELIDEWKTDAPVPPPGSPGTTG